MGYFLLNVESAACQRRLQKTIGVALIKRPKRNGFPQKGWGTRDSQWSHRADSNRGPADYESVKKGNDFNGFNGFNHLQIDS